MGAAPHASPEPETQGWEGFVKALTTSVFKPVVNRILKAGWIVRALVLLLIGVAWVCWIFRDWAMDVGRVVIEIPVALTHPDSLPLNVVQQKYVDLDITALASYLGAELQKVKDKNPNHNVWATSQEVVATAHLNSINSNFIAEAIQSKRNRNCDCFTEYAEGIYAHSASANWAAVAFSRLGLKLSEKDLDFILKNQHEGGWWAAFPAEDDKQNASTYATAWSLLALNAQLTAGLVDQNRNNQVQGAISRGKAWLLNLPIEHGRWMDYPFAPSGEGQRSIGLSGLVLHVLHRLEASTSDLDREWLNNLPDELSDATVGDANAYPVTMPEPVTVSENRGTPTEKDGVRQLRLPWTIVATVDAYSSGDLVQRAKALRYVKNVTNSLNELTKPVLSNIPWAAAELEIAIRYLRHDQPSNKDVI